MYLIRVITDLWLVGNGAVYTHKEKLNPTTNLFKRILKSDFIYKTGKLMRLFVFF